MVSNVGTGHPGICFFLRVPPLSPPLNIPAPVLMASSDDSRTHRVKKITEFIGKRKLTLNDFLISFYSLQDTSVSAHRGRCLTKSDGARFAPEVLIDLWLEHCPQKSQDYLESVIVDRASRILAKETDKACGLGSLHVPTTELTANDLDEDFLLSKLETTYTETLPHLWLLLTFIITSWNASERRRGEPSACKENRVKHVESPPQLFTVLHIDRSVIGLHRYYQYPAFFEEPRHKCIPNDHGAVPWDLWGIETRPECL